VQWIGLVLSGDYEIVGMHDCMNELLQNLIKLQAIEFEETTEKNVGATIAELRVKIPAQILGHYDRLIARGKKGVAAIRGENCASCHIRVPIGAIMTLKRGEDIQLCENCGRYLFLPDKVEVSTPLPVAPPKRTKKPRVIKRELHPV
jgi:predicted  nucleic acid-binding Zn-ribbon protein